MILEGLLLVLIIVILESIITNTLTYRIRRNLKKIFSTWTGIDRILRLIQYTSIIMIASYEESSMFIMDHSQLLMIGKAYKLGRFSNGVNKIRKAMRFIRGGILFKRIKNTEISSPPLTSEEKLYWLQTFLLFLSDITDFSYNITDHYRVFYLLNLVGNQELLGTLSHLGNLMWITSSLIVIPAIIIRLYQLTLSCKSEEEYNRRKTLAWIDIFRNTLEVIMGFFFVYSNLVRKSTVGVVAIMTTSLGLIRFDFL